MFDNYIFVSRDSTGRFGQAFNPAFIAKHTYCRAVKRESILKSFDSIKLFISSLNEETLSKDTIELMTEFEL